MLQYRIYEDVRHAFRLISGNPSLSLAVFLSLALGIGASASMFGIVDSFLLRPLPVPETKKVLRLASVNQSSAVGDLSYPDFEDLRTRAEAFTGLVSVRTQPAAISTRNGAQSRITLGLIVSGDFFQTLGIRPVLGRTFRPEEDQAPDRDAVVVLSYQMWQRDFGASPDVLGKTIRVNRREFTIIGVAAREFTGVNPMLHPDVYVPRMMTRVLIDNDSKPLTDRGLRNVEVYGRLKPGTGIEAARAEVSRIARQLEQENPATNKGQSLAVYTQAGFRIAEDPEDLTAAMLFLLVGALVLGVACVNVANLLLSTAPARIRETAVRLAMGATRARLTGQFIIESAVLALAATAAGLVLAALVARFVSSVEISAGFLPITIEMRVDARVAIFAFLVGAASGVLAGLIPALRCSRGDLNQLMRSFDPRAARSRNGFRQGLVAAQVALATIVLVLSGLAVQSLSLLRKADPGFRFDNVLTMALDPTVSRGLSVPETHRFYNELLSRVRGLAGVESVTLAKHLPLGISDSATEIAVEGFAMPEGQKYVPVSSSVIADDYFKTLDIPFVSGRAFNAQDTSNAPRAVIINEAMAEKFWPGRDALGGRIEMRGATAVTAQVVGIVRTTKYRQLIERPMPVLFLPLEQSPETFMWLMAATKSDAAAFTPTIRKALTEFDANLPVFDTRTMNDIVRRQAVWGDLLVARIAGGAALVALLLGVLGLYGMLAYSVSQRTREIGIRMAVGATTQRIYRMIIVQGLKLSGAGIVVGVLLAGGLASLVPDMSAPADPQDPIVYGAVIAILLAVTLLACYQPARKAARTDPNRCLRAE